MKEIIQDLLKLIAACILLAGFSFIAVFMASEVVTRLLKPPLNIAETIAGLAMAISIFYTMLWVYNKIVLEEWMH